MENLLIKENIAVIIPSFHSEVLTSICIRSFKKFCPSNIDLYYIVVENSTDVSYKDRIVEIDPNVLWINNDTHYVGSEANAAAIELGLEYVKCDLVFMCHCDVCVTNESFLYNVVAKYHEGNRVIGTLFDTNPNRIGAIHVMGLLTDLELAKKVDYMPVYKSDIQIMDVGNKLIQYCTDNNLSTYCFKNTFNYPEISSLTDKYREFNVSKCVSEKNEVLFMHLGRGIRKLNGRINNKVNMDEWVSFCEEIIVL